jgi:hypothetical protein
MHEQIHAIPNIKKLCPIPLLHTTQLVVECKHQHRTLSWVDLTIHFHSNGCLVENSCWITLSFVCQMRPSSAMVELDKKYS